LIGSEERRKALIGLFRETLDACAPEQIVFDRIEPRADSMGFACPMARFDVKRESQSRLWVFGAGKAVLRMAEGLGAKLGNQISGGALIVPSAQLASKDRLGKLPIQLLPASHPHVDESSVRATERLMGLASECGAHDHVIFLLSGGASALLAKPVHGLPIQQVRMLVSSLMDAGASIQEINIVRKHLSEVKGGKLLSRFACAVTVLVFSDVVGNSLSAIGSGPLHPDDSTIDEARAIVDAYCPHLVREFERYWTETPKSHAVPARHVVLADGKYLAETAARLANRSKDVFAKAEWAERPVTLEVGALAAFYSKEVRNRTAELRETLRETSEERVEKITNQLFIHYGEPTVFHTGIGTGGRSQHLALAVARELKNIQGWTFLAAGSDGIDGPTSAAGACVGPDTISTSIEQGLSPELSFKTQDSNAYHKAMGTLIETGETGNNLNDLHFVWVSVDS